MVTVQILILFMILSAIIAIEAKNLFASIIAFGLLGLELALAFILLRSPDIAITFLILEMIVLAIFSGAVLKKNPKFFPEKDVFSSLTFIAFGVLFIMVCMRAFLDLPAFGMPLMKLAGIYNAESLPKTGASNIVAAIMFNFRSFDSLIVIMILFLTSMGVFNLTEKKK